MSETVTTVMIRGVSTVMTVRGLSVVHPIRSRMEIAVR